MDTIIHLVKQVGNSVFYSAKKLFSVVGLFYDTLLAISGGNKKVYHSSFKQAVSQVLFTGVDAMGIVTIVALLCGVTIIIQASTMMPQFGIGDYFGKILVISVVRELGPFFTAVVVIGRSGAALAAYIGNMKIAKEVSALTIMGIDPVHFLVMPAFIGMIISITCLNIYFDVVAVLGGLFVAGLTVHIPFGIFLARVVSALTVTDTIVSLLKSILFGGVISIVSCYNGLAVSNIREVSRAVHKAVVGSMIFIIVAQAVITILVYG